MERKKTIKEPLEDVNIHKSSTGESHNAQSRSKSIGELEQLKGDKLNILILSFLYVLQGIPLGLAGSIPMILQNKNVSYKEQAVFSFVTWPFSLKLLWAPIVDSVYYRPLGRRKSWLIPSQFLIGFTMIILSRSVNQLLGDSNNPPNVWILTISFFCMNFLAATQDIAVDGWALTMLSRRNVGYASTCNSVGQTAGYFLGNVIFMALESADFCNKYFRSTPLPDGIVTLSGFLFFWGIIFFITTTLILILKTEREEKRESETFSIKQTYMILYSLLSLRNIRLLVGLLLTSKIAFAATDALVGLKLMERGVQKEVIGFIAIPLVPLQIILPLVISRYTAGPKPLAVFLVAYPFRVLFGVVYAGLVWWTSVLNTPSGLPSYYYVVVIICFGLHQITVYSIFVALMAFFSQISDPLIGGTYMTFMNTITNLGSNWPATLSLWFVDYFTYKSCEGATQFSCDNPKLAAECTEAGHSCVTSTDGFYIETALCVVIGFLWLRWCKGAVRKLQSLPLTAWSCPR